MRVLAYDDNSRPDKKRDVEREPEDCVAPVRHGWACKRPSIPDAPFPICIKHAAEIFSFLHTGIAKETPLAAAIRTLETYDQGSRDGAVPVPGKGRPVVYYLRIGNHIKIGYSANLASRMGGYPPDTEVLAVEPGGRDLERLRHRQFAHQLRMGLEWFAPSLDLLLHIESLRSVAEEPGSLLG